MTDDLHKQRIDFISAAPDITLAMRALGKTVDDYDLDAGLRDMMKVRASQINACAFCLEMHVREARRHGITDDRLHLLGVWREAPCFDEAERAALELTEAVTQIGDGGVPDALYQRVRRQFSERQYIGLLTTIAVINAWNRLMIGVGAVPRMK